MSARSEEGGSPPGDELGAHVSSAGGVDRAPGRAREIESVRLQLFTKTPNQWAEPEVDEPLAQRFAAARDEYRIGTTVSHDSYLINLSSPDPQLWARSYACFEGELRRCVALGIDFLVTHPGNATDRDQESGVARNAEGVTRALETVEGPTKILLELTAGSGTSVGGSFELLARILERIPESLHHRLGVCFDTCHAYAAGYDLVNDYEGVMSGFDDVLGLDRLCLFHMNDSKHPLESRKDRHQHIGQGSLGEEPFRRIMTDERFEGVPKILETPKEDDAVANDLRNLRLLRSFRR